MFEQPAKKNKKKTKKLPWKKHTSGLGRAAVWGRDGPSGAGVGGFTADPH